MEESSKIILRKLTFLSIAVFIFFLVGEGVSAAAPEEKKPNMLPVLMLLLDQDVGPFDVVTANITNFQEGNVTCPGSYSHTMAFAFSHPLSLDQDRWPGFACANQTCTVSEVNSQLDAAWVDNYVRTENAVHSGVLNGDPNLSGVGATLSADRFAMTITVNNNCYEWQAYDSIHPDWIVWSLYDAGGVLLPYLNVTPSSNPPSAPSGLAISSPTTSALTLNWTDNSNNENGFNIYRSTSSNGTYTNIGSVSANTTTYTATGLSQSTTYWFKVLAYNTAGDSEFSNAASGTTESVITVPSAPSNINATNITDSSVRITWTDNSNNETGFQIGTCTYLTDGQNIICWMNWSTLYTTGSNATYYDISGLQPGTLYRYFVRSYNTAGESSAYGVAFTTENAVTTTTFYPSMDNLVMINSLNSNVENTSYPSSIDLAVGCNWSYNSFLGMQDFVCAQSLIYFNLNSLSGKTIHSATLRLEVYSYGVGYFPRTWHVWANATSWTSTVTWNNVSSMLHYTAHEINGLSPPGSYGYVDVDVTTMVEAWADGSWNNFGFILGSDDYSFPYYTSFDAFAFYSSEDTGGGKPKLIVTYQ